MDIIAQNLNPIKPPMDIELTATIPLEMINAQQQLITWCDNKLIYLKKESDDLKGAYEHAKKMKWKSSALYGQYNRSVKQITYYEKIKAALLEGYYIVPNFPITMFAVRTKASYPKQGRTTFWRDSYEQEPQDLEINKGEYKNPFPLMMQRKYTNYEGKEETEYWASGWDSIEFPITMAKPQIMEATTRAMALKLFDEIGIMPAASKKEDPVILGTVRIKNGNNIRKVSFMIAWHLNTNIL